MEIHDKTVVVGILARNCVEMLRNNILRVEELGKSFSDYHVIIYENDSDDGTVELLQEWQANNPHVVAICEKTKNVTIPKKTAQCPHPAKSVYRISKMVKFRNRLLDEVRARFTPDFFIMIDIDIENFESSGVVTAIEKAPKDWGALFANAHIMFYDNSGEMLSPFQYDSYALIMKGIDYMKTHGWVVMRRFHDVTVYTVEKNIRENEYFPCASAFNGIGVYKWEVIKDLSFRVDQTEELKKINACFCEHVPFSSDIQKKGYGVYIARSMKVIYFHKKRTLMRRFTWWKKQLRVNIILHFSSRIRGYMNM